MRCRALIRIIWACFALAWGVARGRVEEQIAGTAGALRTALRRPMRAGILVRECLTVRARAFRLGVASKLLPLRTATLRPALKFTVLGFILERPCAARSALALLGAPSLEVLPGGANGLRFARGCSVRVGVVLVRAKRAGHALTLIGSVATEHLARATHPHWFAHGFLVLGGVLVDRVAFPAALFARPVHGSRLRNVLLTRTTRTLVIAFHLPMSAGFQFGLGGRVKRARFARRASTLV
jgi:hypothetical protein